MQPQLEKTLSANLRDFSAVTCYAPRCARLVCRGRGTKSISKATAPTGRFGDLVDQERLYRVLETADHFELVTLEENWSLGKKRSTGRIQDSIPTHGQDSGPMRQRPHWCYFPAIARWERFAAAHNEDVNLAADVLLENLAAKVTSNQPALRLFRYQISRYWHEALRRRSQGHRVNWERLKRLTVNTTGCPTRHRCVQRYMEVKKKSKETDSTNIFRRKRKK
jgi:hypothetical protein